ncbi:MAG: hypothetical protein JWL72_3704 [Ilumatobacteraceae bacterium]|nr:hypothetical protein [Ilumatobacteraceae bacterium]
MPVAAADTAFTVPDLQVPPPLVPATDAPAFCTTVSSSRAVLGLSTAIVGAVSGDPAADAVVAAAINDLAAASAQATGNDQQTLGVVAMGLGAVRGAVSNRAVDANTVAVIQLQLEALDIQMRATCGFSL